MGECRNIDYHLPFSPDRVTQLTRSGSDLCSVKEPLTRCRGNETTL